MGREKSKAIRKKIPGWKRFWLEREMKAKPNSIKEIEKCEKFCQYKDDENTKFSILIGVPELIQVDGILGIKEYT